MGFGIYLLVICAIIPAVCIHICLAYEVEIKQWLNGLFRMSEKQARNTYEYYHKHG